jgi:hypothetical protein
MNIYDKVPAYTVEDRDQVIIDGDPLEDVEVTDTGDAIIIVGTSNNTGDVEVYSLDPDALVELWAV